MSHTLVKFARNFNLIYIIYGEGHDYIPCRKGRVTVSFPITWGGSRNEL